MALSLTVDQGKVVKQVIQRFGQRISANHLAFLLKRHLQVDVSAEDASELISTHSVQIKTNLEPLKKDSKPKDLRGACTSIINEAKEILSSEGVFAIPPVMTTEGLSALLFLSDLHFGERVEINGIEVFNLEIAKERLHSIVSQFILAPELDGYEVDECVVILGGDIIDGEMIFPAQSFESEGHVFHQVQDAARILWLELSVLSKYFKTVRVYCVPGNHGRSSKLHHQMSNWDNVLYFGLQIMANIEKTNIEVTTPHQMWMDLKVRNWAVHIRHIGVTQPVSAGPAKKVLTWMDNHSADLLFYGHYHSPEQYSVGHRRVFKNGALPPMNDFAENLGFQEGSGQWMVGLTDRTSVAFSKILLPD